jgi:hypothetical protein
VPRGGGLVSYLLLFPNPEFSTESEIIGEKTRGKERFSIKGSPSPRLHSVTCYFSFLELHLFLSVTIFIFVTFIVKPLLVLRSTMASVLVSSLRTHLYLCILYLLI